MRKLSLILLLVLGLVGAQTLPTGAQGSQGSIDIELPDGWVERFSTEGVITFTYGNEQKPPASITVWSEGSGIWGLDAEPENLDATIAYYYGSERAFAISRIEGDDELGIMDRQPVLVPLDTMEGYLLTGQLDRDMAYIIVPNFMFVLSSDLGTQGQYQDDFTNIIGQVLAQ